MWNTQNCTVLLFLTKNRLKTEQMYTIWNYVFIYLWIKNTYNHTSELWQTLVRISSSYSMLISNLPKVLFSETKSCLPELIYSQMKLRWLLAIHQMILPMWKLDGNSEMHIYTPWQEAYKECKLLQNYIYSLLLHFHWLKVSSRNNGYRWAWIPAAAKHDKHEHC